MVTVALFLLENSRPIFKAVFFLHLLSTVFMCGIIWFVQIVHYPLFRRIGDYEFSDYHKRHVSHTGLVVGPPMVVEMVTAGILVFLSPSSLSNPGFAFALVLLALIWFSTALIQMPLHYKLRRDTSPLFARQLVRSNWVRTVAWSARALILSWLWLQPCLP